jgi:tetratricopeptide (TPR) repeat protein
LLNNPDFENSEYLYYSLAQCHYKLGQLKTAIKWLSKSYDMYRTGVQKNNSQRYISSSRAALELYCKVLRIDGNTALADSIMNKHDWS